MIKQVFVLVCLMLANSVCMSQRLQWNGFKLTEENDFLSLTQRGLDRYYTQGLQFEFCYTTQRPKFLEKILIPASSRARNQYSISIAQQIFTPRITNKHPSEFTGVDMPYAGNLYIKQQLNSYDSTKRMRFTSAFLLGMVGPISLGEHTQAFFHKIIKNNPAVGWATQIPNDVLINYSFRVEKKIKQLNLFALEAKAEAKAGTLLISGAAGLNLKLGNWQKSDQFSWEVFFLPEVRTVAYNALLQGGIINRLSGGNTQTPYFLNEIKPVVYTHSTGFQVRYKRFELLYRQVNITREFSSQLPHYYGSATLTFWFRGHSPFSW